MQIGLVEGMENALRMYFDIQSFPIEEIIK